MISGDRIAWITFTNDHYYYFMGRPFSNSVREGFARDRFEKYQFEWHNLKRKIPDSRFLSMIDLPKQPVKCHGVFSHLMIVRTETLESIGECSDWSKYTLLIDEDWSLRALQKGYWNAWIPQIIYTHPNPYNAWKRIRDLRFQNIVHEQFNKQWGFGPEYNDICIEVVRKKYKETNILWSIGRNTFDWDFVS
jgi:hypothetical protein